jgi:hypothetical protein
MSGVNQKLSSIETIVHEIRNLIKALKHDKYTSGEGDNAAKEDRLAHAQAPVVPKIEPTPIRSHKSHDCQYQSTPKWKARLEVAALLFGVGYAIVTGLLWWDQHQNFKIDERAWMINTEVVPSHRSANNAAVWLTAGEKAAFGVKFINSGKTPALNLNAKFTVKTFDRGVPFAPIYDDSPKPASSVILAPGVTDEINTEPDDPISIIVTDVLLQKLSRSDTTLRLYGEIEYSDIFKCRHKTTFCMYLSVDLASFKHCDTYNDAN